MPCIILPVNSIDVMFDTDSCRKVSCPGNLACIEDQHRTPHCVPCSKYCKPAPELPVCGADGVTYPSKCNLQAAACSKGHAVPLAYYGACIGKHIFIFTEPFHGTYEHVLVKVGSGIQV